MKRKNQHNPLESDTPKKPLQLPPVHTKRIDSAGEDIQPVKYATPVSKTTSYERLMKSRQNKAGIKAPVAEAKKPKTASPEKVRLPQATMTNRPDTALQTPEPPPEPHKPLNPSVKSNLPQGLSTDDVEVRKLQGKVNLPIDNQSKTIQQIVRSNTLTVFNFLNLVLGALVIFAGLQKPTYFLNLTFLGVAISNTLVGIIQEVRAKKTIDQLAILTEPHVWVIRDQTKQQLSVHELVVDDVIQLTAGNQIAVDALFLEGEGFEVDEALLTGEADHIMKQPNDELFAGSVVMAGTGYARVTRVSQDTVAAKIAMAAKAERKKPSVIMSSLNRIIKILSIVMIPVGISLFISNLSKSFSSDVPATLVGVVAALIGMIPEGLMLLTSVAFAVGVINLGRKKMLVQTLPSIEMLARVDTICLDKTGTITNGQMRVKNIYEITPDGEPTIVSEADHPLQQSLAAFVWQTEASNATQDALKAFCAQPEPRAEDHRVPFSSKRKWSGVQFANGETLVMGAPEFIFPAAWRQSCTDASCLKQLEAIDKAIQTFANEGLRVLLLARATSPFGADQTLPENCQPYGLITLMDQIREDVHQTLAYFKDQGVTVKVISGDNPRTVCAVAKTAGVENADAWIDMSQLDDQVDLRDIVEKYTLFGRVTPFQKQQLVQALQFHGHVVSMTGDGVNDVPALKEADCAVAMKSGSDAARAVADLVLLADNVNTMVDAVYEGRRVINNIERVASLFLVKTIWACLLSFLYIFLPFRYPLLPIQISLISTLTIGFPSFVLALKPNKERIKGHFLRNVILRAVPGGITATIMLVLSQIISHALKLGTLQRSTLAVIILGFVGFLILKKVCTPMDWMRRTLFYVCAIGFLGAVLLLPNLFFLANILTPLIWIYLPAIFLCYALFVGLQLIGQQLVKLKESIQKNKMA